MSTISSIGAHDGNDSRPDTATSISGHANGSATDGRYPFHTIPYHIHPFTISCCCRHPFNGMVRSM
jgi:hypothetical protein